MTDPTRPLYAQVADELRQRIRSGELPPGSLVPANRDLAAAQGISRGTAEKAISLLVQEGLVTPGATRAGRRVRDRRVLPVHASRSEKIDHRRSAGVDAWVSDTQEHGRTPGQTIDVGVVSATAQIAAWLDVPEGSPVAVRRRLRTLDGAPSNRADTYYPLQVTQDIPEILDPADVPQGVIALMAERGYVQTHYIDRLEWRPPTPEEASELAIDTGVSVLVQWRTGYTAEGAAVKLTRSLWPGDTIQLVYELPA